VSAPGPAVRLAHGAGSRLTRELVAEVFARHFGNPVLHRLEDSAEICLPGRRVALTTDAHVVRPLFFPGGDIGRLAVCGTVNDLAAKGARPHGLSLAFIIAEGLPLESLDRVAASAGAAAREAGVDIVAGDTKVVEASAADGLFVVSAGVGAIPEGRDLAVAGVREGDRLVLTGHLAEHGVAVLNAREGLGLAGDLRSDCAPLNGLAESALAACPGLRALRDPTRGGLAAACLEIAAASGRRLVLQEDALPLRPAVRAACDLLGLDPLHVANEGLFLAAVAPDEADRLLAALRAHPLGTHAAVVGHVAAGREGVEIETQAGGRRALAWMEGEPLPRIC
jgi:hydrogenase expression/formation protein HypE